MINLFPYLIDFASHQEGGVVFIILQLIELDQLDELHIFDEAPTIKIYNSEFNYLVNCERMA